MNSNDKQNINAILSQSLILGKSKKFIDFFKFLARFNHYSNFNSMLVYIQNQNVAYYGTRGFWRRKFKREVRQEARPYIILTPFSPVSLVYDIVDTIGEKSAEELLEKGIPYEFFAVKGEFDQNIYERLLERVDNWGIYFRYEPMSFFSAGFVSVIDSKRLQICLNTHMSPAENFAIIIHELAHLLLGHTGYEALKHKKDPDKQLVLQHRRDLGRSGRELEAETVAYLICSKLGLITKSAEYLAGYIRSDTDIVNFNYETVIKITDKIERLFLKPATIPKQL